MPLYSGAFFFLADHRGIICFPPNVRFDRHHVIEILEVTMGGQKIEMCKSLQIGGKLWND